MFPLKSSFNEVVGHLIKLIKFSFSALLLSFVLLARLHSTENPQTNQCPSVGGGWKEFEPKEKGK